MCLHSRPFGSTYTLDNGSSQPRSAFAEVRVEDRCRAEHPLRRVSRGHSWLDGRLAIIRHRWAPASQRCCHSVRSLFRSLIHKMTLFSSGRGAEVREVARVGKAGWRHHHRRHLRLRTGSARPPTSGIPLTQAACPWPLLVPLPWLASTHAVPTSTCLRPSVAA